VISFDRVVGVLLHDMRASGTSSSSTPGSADARSVVTSAGRGACANIRVKNRRAAAASRLGESSTSMTWPNWSMARCRIVVDTANSYAGGHSEEVIGAWLRRRSADVLVATKVGNLVEADQVDICLASDHILRQFPASLQRLGLDKVDMYLSHAPDNSTPVAETLEAFAALMEAGQVGAIGACNISAAQLTEALVEADRLGLPRYEWVQNEYSVLARGDEATVIPICRDHGLGYTPHSVLGGGVLSGKFLPGAELLAGTTVALRPGDYAPYLTAEALEGAQRWAAEAKRFDVGGAALALAWVLSNDDVTAALVGARTPAQFADVSNALELRLDPDQRERLAGLVS
jgi:1-deoxyxylulose-5-phosphate synthase